MGLSIERRSGNAKFRRTGVMVGKAHGVRCIVVVQIVETIWVACLETGCGTVESSERS